MLIALERPSDLDRVSWTPARSARRAPGRRRVLPVPGTPGAEGRLRRSPRWVRDGAADHRNLWKSSSSRSRAALAMAAGASLRLSPRRRCPRRHRHFPRAVRIEAAAALDDGHAVDGDEARSMYLSSLPRPRSQRSILPVAAARCHSPGARRSRAGASRRTRTCLATWCSLQIFSAFSSS